jgi:hypothetical protein
MCGMGGYHFVEVRGTIRNLGSGAAHINREVCVLVVRVLTLFVVVFPIRCVVLVSIPPYIVLGGWLSLCVRRLNS